MLTFFGRWLLQMFYPPRCPGCHQSVKNHGDWCPTCWGTIWQPRLLRGSRDNELDGCYCLADYRGPMRRVLQNIKFNKALKFDASCLFLLNQFPWMDRLTCIDMVVPVPLSKERLMKRGFNQTEIIFRSWAENYWVWTDLLERVKPTQPQWGLSKVERKKNIKRAFIVNGSFCVAQKHILLVDDIYTTGATLNECAHVLKEKGAASVTGLVMASGAS